MDGESEAGSIENGSNVDDEPLLQMVITDDFFTEITTKANAVGKIFHVFFSQRFCARVHYDMCLVFLRI